MSSERLGYVLYCRCAHSAEVPADVKDAVLAALAESDAPFEAVADLCELAARRDPVLTRWAGADGPAIAACWPRAVKWLFHAGGAALADEETRVLDMKADQAGPLTARLPVGAGLPIDGQPVAAEGSLKVVLYEGPGSVPMTPTRRKELLAELLDAGYRVTRTGPAGAFPADTAASIVIGHFEAGRPPESLPGSSGRVVCLDVTEKCACGAHAAVDEAREALGLPKPGQWVPWFPVLDYDRCVGCKQCANFCLFGVFDVTEAGEVRVTHPDKCKTNFPACARMCPQVAVIFPKYPGRPIDGAEVRPEDVRKEKAGTDLKQLLRGDVYNVLRQRSAAAAGGGKPTPDQLAQAADELKIPQHVLASLGVGSGQDAGEAGPCACQAEAACCEEGGCGEEPSCGCGAAAAEEAPSCCPERPCCGDTETRRDGE